MSSLTPMQQAIFMNHQISIQTYLTQLSTAISLLPLSVSTGTIPLLGADAFVALESKPAKESWPHVLAILETVWGKPGAVSPGHVTKGELGVEIVSTLLGHVGAATLAGLEDEERDGAIGWIRAIRDAVREKWCARICRKLSEYYLTLHSLVLRQSSALRPRLLRRRED